jgi:hypothetical protein
MSHHSKMASSIQQRFLSRMLDGRDVGFQKTLLLMVVRLADAKLFEGLRGQQSYLDHVCKECLKAEARICWYLAG